MTSTNCLDTLGSPLEVTLDLLPWCHEQKIGRVILTMLIWAANHTQPARNRLEYFIVHVCERTTRNKLNSEKSSCWSKLGTFKVVSYVQVWPTLAHPDAMHCLMSRSTYGFHISRSRKGNNRGLLQGHHSRVSLLLLESLQTSRNKVDY